MKLRYSYDSRKHKKELRVGHTFKNHKPWYIFISDSEMEKWFKQAAKELGMKKVGE
jgi:hypothetical protein